MDGNLTYHLLIFSLQGIRRRAILRRYETVSWPNATSVGLLSHAIICKIGSLKEAACESA